ASPGLAALDLIVMLGAWGWMLGHFIQLIRTSRAPDRLHAILVACALGLGLVGLAAARVWILTGSARAGDAMETIGMWGFLVPVVVTVSHRMIPFFTANVVPRLVPWRPTWTL